jgi:signal transduction histidine kinase
MTDHTLKVLCIEDSVEDYFLISRVVEKEFPGAEFRQADTSDTIVSELRTFQPDIVLSDHNLPQLNSSVALSLIRSTGSTVPFILVSGEVSDINAVDSVKQGVDDYVLKSNLTRLGTVIRIALKQSETETLRKRASSELTRRNEELSKVNKELDTFVYSVTHNMRSPLASVLGLLNLAKAESGSENLKQYHALIEESIIKLDANLVAILEYSRNAKHAQKIERIELKKLVDECFATMAYMPGFHDFSTDITIDEQSEFHSDKYKLSVILGNLISNAIKYSDHKKPTRLIRMKASVTSTGLSLDFYDNGQGIHPKALNRIFEMFYRASQADQGSGLGLFIVKEAVGSLHGNINVSSMLGEGTRFTIDLPNLKVSLENTAVNSMFVDRN